ncbi:MAG: polysaccharide biosynthesis/export family protein [Paludibacteraceae bacterium]|nr:polysaccharide biosynthesis/export family protein [Paludibacteraceae bacterium]
MRYKQIVILFLFALALGSCVTSKKVNYMQQPSKSIPSYADTLVYTDYVLRKSDRLYVRVYSIDEKISALFNGGQNSNYSGNILRNNGSQENSYDLYTYLVDNNGNIQYPTLGDVYVRGLTVRQVKHLLEDKLSGLIVNYGSLSNISVDVLVVQRNFSMIGVGKAGKFAIPKEKLTIFEALAMAGNINDFGDRSKVHIIREEEDSTRIMTFDVRSEDIINSEFYYIEPNDVIYVQQMRGSSFGISSAASVVSVTAATLSFGVFIYTIVDRFIVRPIKNSQSK